MRRPLVNAEIGFDADRPVAVAGLGDSFVLPKTAAKMNDHGKNPDKFEAKASHSEEVNSRKLSDQSPPLRHTKRLAVISFIVVLGATMPVD